MENFQRARRNKHLKGRVFSWNPQRVSETRLSRLNLWARHFVSVLCMALVSQRILNWTQTQLDPVSVVSAASSVCLCVWYAVVVVVATVTHEAFLLRVNKTSQNPIFFNVYAKHILFSFFPSLARLCVSSGSFHFHELVKKIPPPMRTPARSTHQVVDADTVPALHDGQEGDESGNDPAAADH